MAVVNPADKLSLSLDAIIKQSSRPSGNRSFHSGPARAQADDFGGPEGDAPPRESEHHHLRYCGGSGGRRPR